MKKLLIMTVFCSLVLSACSAQRASHFPSYKLTIHQGNELDPEAVASLQKGMTRLQVQSILGTPLLQDPFHADRWDYPFVVTRNGVVKEHSVLTLFFKNDLLTEIKDGTKTDAHENEAPINP